MKGLVKAVFGRSEVKAGETVAQTSPDASVDAKPEPAG